MTVTDPRQMNTTFAHAFNSRSLKALLALYEPGAVLRAATGDRDLAGIDAFTAELLSADWKIIDGAGAVVASGSSAELVRRQADGTWLYVIDHPTGARPASR